MPSSSQKGDLEPPEELMSEAVRGFLAGAFRFGSVSILAHMILMLPHPFAVSRQPRVPLLRRPLEGLSQWLSPTARIYHGLTPQFKVFLQIAAMTLGGSVYAESRVRAYIEWMRRVKRAERSR